MSTITTPDRFTTLPDEPVLAATVTALEEHGFSVEVVDDLDAARKAVLARIPHGSSVMTNTSVTLAETGIADAINDGGPYDSARNKMFALDFATQAQEMKAIGGQPDYALGSVHAITRDGTLVIASASGQPARLLRLGRRQRHLRRRRAEARPHPGGRARADLPAQPGTGRRPRDRGLRAAQLGREDPGDPPGTARPHPHRSHPPGGRVLMTEPSRLAVLGAGHVGPVIARLAIKAGYPVAIATSGDPEDIALITELIIPGAQPRWASDAVADADIVVLAIPLHRFGDIDPGLLAGKLVVDAMNYWPASDGVLKRLRSTAEAARSWPGGWPARPWSRRSTTSATTSSRTGPGRQAPRTAGRRRRGRRPRGGRHDRGPDRPDRLRPGPPGKPAGGPGAAAGRAGVRGRADAA